MSPRYAQADYILPNITVVYENGQYSYYEHAFLPNSCHGTGDIYASAFTGALVIYKLIETQGGAATLRF